ncbi:MAG TPA: S53 family peptidase, partial [Acidimicrobiales bacterium]
MSKRRGGLALVVALASMGCVLATTVAGPAGASTAGPGPDAHVRVGGRAPVLPFGAVVTGPSDGAATVTADLALKPRDQSALDAFVSAVSTPGSAQYHQYLKAGQFEPLFGPAASTIASARSWLASSGLQVGATSPDGLLIPATGTVSQMERAFSVSVVDTRLRSGRVSRYVGSAPAVPSSLVASVQGVIGLSSLAQPEPQIVKGPLTAGAGTGSTSPTTGGGASGTIAPAPRAASGTHLVGPGSCPSANTVASRNGGYTANQLAATYGLSTLYGQGRDGTGVTIGIYELEPFNNADIAAYQACYGLAATPPTNVPVAGGASGGQSGEAALDIEDVAGLATGAAIHVYSGPQSGNGPVVTYDRMVTDDVAKVLTTSWGVCEPLMATSPGQQAAESAIFAEAAAQGQSMVAASGDSGSTDCYFPPSDTDSTVTVDDPADQPNVTGVGGTSLLGSGPNETAWNDFYGAGGGGVSSDFAMPSWQYGPGIGSAAALTQCKAVGRSSCREVPDVAASSDPAHGYPIYFSGSWGIVGGTSAASPLVAAVTAVVDQGLGAPAGFLNPTLYGAGTCASSPFNDVTAGSNALLASSAGRFSATANYDLATGLGSADAARLETALTTHPSCPVITSVLPAKG